LSLLGIIFVQVYWFNTSLEKSEEQFKFHIKQVFRRCSKKSFKNTKNIHSIISTKKLKTVLVKNQKPPICWNMVITNEMPKPIKQ